MALITITNAFVNAAGNVVVLFSEVGTGFGDIKNFVLQFPPGTNVNLTGGKADFNPAIPATVITLPAGVTIPPGAVFQITATSANTATGGTSVTGGLSEPSATLKGGFDPDANPT